METEGKTTARYRTSHLLGTIRTVIRIAVDRDCCSHKEKKKWYDFVISHSRRLITFQLIDQTSPVSFGKISNDFHDCWKIVREQSSRITSLGTKAELDWTFSPRVTRLGCATASRVERKFAEFWENSTSPIDDSWTRWNGRTKAVSFRKISSIVKELYVNHPRRLQLLDDKLNWTFSPRVTRLGRCRMHDCFSH